MQIALDEHAWPDDRQVATMEVGTKDSLAWKARDISMDRHIEWVTEELGRLFEGGKD